MNVQMPLVTVVIPVYKTEMYLDRCVSSVAGQTYTNLEMILIDDGSPDGCPKQCDDWAERDSRVRVIHKENQGLGMARNTGMARARGKYLCFVDSDDELENTAVEDAVALAESRQADIVLYGMTCMNAVGAVTTRRIPETEKEFYTCREVQESLLPRLISGKQGLTMSACCCLISTELARRTQWRFPSERDIISEDVYALLELFREIRKAAVLKKALYRYYENAASLTHTYRPDRIEKIIGFYRACLSLCEKMGYGEPVRKSCAEPFLSFLIAAMKQEVAQLGIRALPGLQAIVAETCLQQALRETDLENAGWKRALLLGCIRLKWHRLAFALLSFQNRRT